MILGDGEGRGPREGIGQEPGLPFDDPVCGDADFAQMVVIPVPPADQRELQRRLLDEFRIEIPVTTCGGRPFVRLSVQAYTTEADCEALLAALAAIYGV
jgi:isopenicillin-N epimerase